MGTNGKQLSQLLDEQGFFCAFGTTEHIGGVPYLVKARTPRSTDYNNGVTVVYDEKGRPWIKRGSPDLTPFEGQITARGANVPHSNDGGYFVSKVLPDLMAELVKV